MENKIVVSSSFTMAAYLVANPNVVVSQFNNGKLSYFKYDINNGKFYYCCPSNKVMNKWYEARGLKQHFDRGMHDMFSPKRETLKQNIDDEGDLPY